MGHGTRFKKSFAVAFILIILLVVAPALVLAAVLATIVRILLFLHEKGLNLGQSATYEHLDPRLGIYLLAGGLVVALFSKLA